MTTKQLVARFNKYFRTYGSVSLKGMTISSMDNGTGVPFILDRTCTDDNEVGVMCTGDNWFIPSSQLTYKELSQIINIYKNKYGLSK